MTKQLVVVVHGVGVREAGTTTELLSASLKTPELPPLASDDFHLCEPPQYDRGGKARTFPAHLRRFGAPGKNKDKITERVIADFYWGDIAAVRGGALGAVLAFFRIAMGLGHAIRENARDVFPRDTWWHRQGRRIAGSSVLLIHGPVVALTLALLVGILVSWASTFAGNPLLLLSAALGLLPAALVLFSTPLLRANALAGVALLLAVYGLSVWIMHESALRLLEALPETQRDPKLVFDIFITAAVIGGAGSAIAQKTHTYLSRFLGQWLVVSAVLVLLFGLHFIATPATSEGLLVTKACALFAGQTEPAQAAASVALSDGSALRALTQASCQQSFTGIYQIGLSLYAVMLLFMGLSILGMVFVAIVSVLQYLFGGREVTDLATPALGLMLLLWFVLISTIFGVLGFTNIALFEGIAPREVLISALRGLVPAVIGVLLLGVFAAWVFAAKARMFRADGPGKGFEPRSYLDDADGHAERARLLVSKPMLAVPIIFIISLFGLILHALFFPEWEPLNDVLRRGTGTALAALALIGLLLVVYLREEFAAGLGILTDVLAYLNDYSWAQTRFEAQQTERREGRMPAQSFFVDSQAPGFVARLWNWLQVISTRKLDPPRADAPQGYWLRRRIQDRLRVLMATLIATEKPDHLVIIAHSQGTVVALDVLCSDDPAGNGAAWREQVGSITLVTMGSPARHLYTHYFPTSFPDYAEAPRLRRGAGVLDNWVNIFRVDDFVGTHIAADPAANWPIEVPVPANGHTNYWIDRNVTRELQAVLQHARHSGKSS